MPKNFRAITEIEIFESVVKHHILNLYIFSAIVIVYEKSIAENIYRFRM